MSAFPEMSSVVASNSPATVRTPEVKVNRSVSDAFPIVPLSGITKLVPNVDVVAVTANSSVPPIFILTPVSA